ncbi:MAG: molecular chaperone TorD family protein, partial [Pseudomonadota bacterium]
ASAVALSEEDRSRADVYALLGALLARAPDAAMLGLLKQIPVSQANGDATLAAAWAMLRQAAERAVTAGLEEEYFDLFVGLGRGELVPYGSWYVTGFLMERPLAELRIDLKRLGMERRADVHEPEDHAAALCETMSLLIAGGDEAQFEEQREFFAKHVAPWMGRFFGDLAQAQSAHFYRSVGLLGERFLEVERTYFSMLV